MYSLGTCLKEDRRIVRVGTRTNLADRASGLTEAGSKGPVELRASQNCLEEARIQTLR